MIDMFENSQQEGQIYDYIDDLGFYASNPENGWSSKKKIYEILWELQKQLKTLPTFPDEKQWVKNRKEALGVK